MKREDYINWDEYFMGVAMLSAKRSKDPSTQVGACIVNNENRIMSVGYNGMPRGCSDEEFPWDRAGGMLDTKYAFVCHADEAKGEPFRTAGILYELVSGYAGALC